MFAHDLDIPVYVFSDGEEKTVKDLKKHYEFVFGDTDINNCPFITILDDTDFEGYLFDAGLGPVIEEAICDVENNEYIDKWIEKRQGTPLRPIRTKQPPCDKCLQPIFESPIRDYTGADGRKNALREILDSKKPKYAAVVAEKLCSIGKDKFPSKIVQFFDKILSGGDIK